MPVFRHSRQRQLVFAYLRATTRHPTAAAIHADLRHRLPRLSLGTVYRNLEILRQQGLVQVLAGNGRETRYDARLVPHAHFFCRRCQRVEDLPLTRELTRAMPALARPGGRVEDVRVELTGLCPPCRRIFSHHPGGHTP